MACNYNRSEKIYDINVGGKSIVSSEEHEEYNQQRDAVAATDSFPCGHVICHHCLRRYVDIRRPTWACPVCSHEFQATSAGSEHMTPVSYTPVDGNNVISMLSNFEGIVSKFNGINRHIGKLKKEQVKSRSIGMCYKPLPCDCCHEDHGSLIVVQEYDNLTVTPERTPFLLRRSYMYGLPPVDRVVTTYDCNVSTSCVCVPCTYKDMQQNPEKFYALTENNNLPDLINSGKRLPIAEVGKLVTKFPSPSKSLKGKNVIEVEHKVKVTNKYVEFDFRKAAEHIKRIVRHSEIDLINIARKSIHDTGGLFHVKEQNTVDFDPSETLV